ncbi:Uncharacterised protein [Salmonella enterica subsp. arizonae]|uniref:Uncharacterized protein n=1 Tax=Salmonella enterica subsp. arizonae TaxID=59203 RepID=A0A379SZC3_SALER|nr:Uncharacterised protein [Salmonella enterica subsp. arizonae]
MLMGTAKGCGFRLGKRYMSTAFNFFQDSQDLGFGETFLLHSVPPLVVF